MELLSFGKKNAKLGKLLTFSLPAGYSCPGAKDCLAFANKETGKIKDGADTQFRCFAASGEALFPNVRKSRWKNYNLLRNCDGVLAMANLIDTSIKGNPAKIHIHVSGDMFSQDYLDAWLTVAYRRPETTFYFYTKSLPLWIARIGVIGNGHTRGILHNVVPTASYGGKFDNLIAEYGLRSAKVVFSKGEAKRSKLRIDHTDELAWKHGKDFALLLHGTQPAKTKAAKALQKLKQSGNFGYGEAANRRRELTLV